MIDTLIVIMLVMNDTLQHINRFEKAFEEADKKFNIELMKQASKEAVKSATKKTYIQFLKIVGRKEE